MNTLKKLYIKAGQNPIKSAVIITLVAALVLFLMNRATGTDEMVEEAKTLPEVTLSTAQGFAGGDSLSLLGNVRAATEAAVTTERAGRVVRVNATLGQTVSAGQVLATLENAAESAAVVQAEGAYDAAVAAKAQAEAADRRDSLGVNESQNTLLSAQNAAVNAYKSAYTTVNGIVLNNIDTFFTSPNTQIPGLRIDGFGQTSYLNSERVQYQTLLQQWQADANSLSVNDNLTAALREAEANVDRTVAIVDTFITLFNRQGAASGRYSDAELQSFSTNFTTLRASLVSTKG
jgi:multidrug efflux pump subunit AcrA (membrane-fusion protein)